MNQVQINQPSRQGIPSQLVQDQFNADYANALAASDPRYQMKELDRGGMSRGAGQMNQAGIRGSQQLADGIAAAYSRQLSNQAYNADPSNSREMFGQALGGLQQQNNYANQMAALQRQGALFGLIGNLIR
jgi:hypothetical protein